MTSIIIAQPNVTRSENEIKLSAMISEPKVSREIYFQTNHHKLQINQSSDPFK